VFETKVRRKIFGPKRDEGTGEWRKLHSGELHDLHSNHYSSNQEKMRWAGHVARGEKRRGKVHAGLWREKFRKGVNL
jgi:hypothetical protein